MREAFGGILLRVVTVTAALADGYELNIAIVVPDRTEDVGVVSSG